jgi:hypothetical protein
MGMGAGREIAPESEETANQGDGLAQYAAPIVLRLGKTHDLILGYWDEGWADYSRGYKHAGE